MNVFDEPLLMSEISKHLSINDMLNLKFSGSSAVRFHETLSYEIDEREKELHAQKLKNFQETMVLFMKEQDTPRERIRQLNQLFDFLADNMWFRDEPKFKHLDDMFQTKLIKLVTTHAEYSHDALFYLAEIYGIYVKAEYDEDSDWMIEYIIDLNGNKHQI